MSYYDYRDPGTDSEYCNGLSAFDDESELPEGWVSCIYCGNPYFIVTSDHDPYCSSLCGIQAQVDDAQA